MDDNPGDIRSSETLAGISLKKLMAGKRFYFIEGFNNPKKGIVMPSLFLRNILNTGDEKFVWRYLIL
ncbi:MAG TPA: hypothetical protein VN370_05360 [Desulfitobacteriaceae bacterium]|jgi:hypothetical protein|nr:hypothetical protein [Desulfitobacteriaceae bacterium]